MKTFVVALGLLAVLLSMAAANASARGVTAHRVSTAPADVARYWTAERMRGAIPRQGAVGKAGKPGSGTRNGYPFSSGAVALVSGTYAGADRMNGKVFFTENGVNYVCSGTSVATATAQAVWTAGHCVNEGPGAFVSNWAFVPAYVDGVRPFGTFAATTLYTTTAWRSTGNFSYDLGAATVTTSSSGYVLGTAVGGRAVASNYGVSGLHVRAYGYPAAGKFNGQRQRFCDATVALRDSGSPQPMGIGCDMTGGSSGGAWVNDGGAIVSVNSYGYQSLKNVMFGPYQDTVAQTLVGCARGQACDATVTPG